MSGRAIRVVTLFPDVMNVYADRGNLIALRTRAAAHGITSEVTAVGVGDELPAAADVVLIGGGQDREQQRVAPDLQRHAATLRGWVEERVAVLAVCGGFQLFGRSYRTSTGEEIDGVGVFDMTTVAPPPGAERCVGEVLARCTIERIGEVVGFENHAGRTYLGPRAEPFAIVERGWGNNGLDGTEGARVAEAIGTYLHGSLLPRHPRLSDRLIEAGLRHRYGEAALEALPPEPLAERAHRAAVGVARRRGRAAAAGAQ